jgi:hypothetical protein
MVVVRDDENHWFDKIIWNDFERPKDGPQGGQVNTPA